MFNDLKVNVELFGSKEIGGLNGCICDYYFVDWTDGIEEGCFPVRKNIYENMQSEIFIDYFGCFDWHDSSERMREADHEKLMKQLDEFCELWEGSCSQDELTRDFENHVMTLVEDELW